MKHQKKKPLEMPSAELLRAELRREQRFRRYYSVFRKLVVVAVIVVLVAILFIPVLQIYGSSMAPTLSEGNIVVFVKGTKVEQGDLVSFYLGDKLLVKRYVAGPGQWVDIDEFGNVYVDGDSMEEPYVVEKALGDCDISLPYQVPEGRIFVMGDHRSTSVDSRNTAVGCVAEEQIVGRIIFRIWPLSEFGLIR